MIIAINDIFARSLSLFIFQSVLDIVLAKRYIQFFFYNMIHSFNELYLWFLLKVVEVGFAELSEETSDTNRINGIKYIIDVWPSSGISVHVCAIIDFINCFWSTKFQWIFPNWK